jgi:hypothetical protein
VVAARVPGVGAEEEPRVGGALPVGHPLAAGVALAEAGEQRVRRIGASDLVVDAQPHRLLTETLELVVGAVEVHVEAANHPRDRLVCDVRERLLAELEEREVSGVTQVQHLEVVLVRLVHDHHQAVEVLDHPVAA